MALLWVKHGVMCKEIIKVYSSPSEKAEDRKSYLFQLLCFAYNYRQFVPQVFPVTARQRSSVLYCSILLHFSVSISSSTVSRATQIFYKTY
jgi:hypothetical protein